MKTFFEKAASSLFNLFFPDCCAGCDEQLSTGEQILCIRCMNSLPETGFHLLQNNPVERIFLGRFPFQAATACYFFHKASVLQNIIHRFKYHGGEDIALYMGNRMGYMLRESAVYGALDGIVPVPLYFSKEKKRGYNQAMLLSEGIAEVLHLPVIKNAIKRVYHTESQTRKSRPDRWENVKKAFRVTRPDKLQGRHLLLVDDVITTGATLEACAQPLLRIPEVRLSIAALAMAEY